MDFQKAFDSVPHRRLLGKLRSYGIEGNVLQWIEAFLRYNPIHGLYFKVIYNEKYININVSNTMKVYYIHK